MCCYKKLTIRKSRQQTLYKNILPCGVEMKLQFINKNNTITFQRIFQSWVANRKALREVAQQGYQAFFPVREL